MKLGQKVQISLCQYNANNRVHLSESGKVYVTHTL